MGSRPKPPKQTQAQKSFERAQQEALSKEIEDENRRRKALIRGSLGAVSLLSGIPSPATVQPGGAGAGPGAGATGGADSLSGSGVLTGAPSGGSASPKGPRGRNRF